MRSAWFFDDERNRELVGVGGGGKDPGALTIGELWLQHSSVFDREKSLYVGIRYQTAKRRYYHLAGLLLVFAESREEAETQQALQEGSACTRFTEMQTLPSGPTSRGANAAALVEECRPCADRDTPELGEPSLLFNLPHCCGLYGAEKAAAVLDAIGEEPREAGPGDAG
ncbi:hypothetical protein MMC13_000750 [Lambiella insularis]|nr:hypothetical protein [Lambiella insularis]